MKFEIGFKEIEAFIYAKAGILLAIRCKEDVIRFQPRNMEFLKNRVKVSVRIDNTYMVPNRLKLHVSAGILSKLVVPKVMALLDFMPKGSVARQADGVVYVMLDKITQLETFCSNCRIDRITFDDAFKRIAVDMVFSENSGIIVNEIPDEIEDSWDEATSLKDRERGEAFIEIARSIFESDRVDEGIQTLKDKAKELKDSHGEELKNASKSFLKDKLRKHVGNKGEG